jgi:hypothetical protein
MRRRIHVSYEEEDALDEGLHGESECICMVFFYSSLVGILADIRSTLLLFHH